MPASICNKCTNEIIKFYTFRQKTIEADLFFRKIVDNTIENETDANIISPHPTTSTLCDNNFVFVPVHVKKESLDTLSIDKNTFSESENANCSSDNASIYDPKESDCDSEVENEKDYPHKCVICFQRFQNLNEILPHVEKLHSGFLKKKTSAKRVKKDKNTKNKRNRNIKKVNEIKKSESDNENEKDYPHKCSLCNKRFLTESEIEPHINQTHVGTENQSVKIKIENEGETGDEIDNGNNIKSENDDYDSNDMNESDNTEKKSKKKRKIVCQEYRLLILFQNILIQIGS